MGETGYACTVYVGNTQREKKRYCSTGLEHLMCRNVQGDANCITVWSGGVHINTRMLDCIHYHGAFSIQEPSECERDACRSVGWRLQASWRLFARRPDDAVQSRQTAASFFPFCLTAGWHIFMSCTIPTSMGLCRSRFSLQLLKRRRNPVAC